MAEKSEQKWQGKVSSKLTRTTADQIWPLYIDFCSIHKWVEILDTSYHLEGSPAPGKPGCIRYCSGPAVLSKQVKERAWSREKLLFMDPVEKYFTYEINESNMGFDNYLLHHLGVRAHNHNIRIQNHGNVICKLHITITLKTHHGDVRMHNQNDVNQDS
ncbi:hypothetical protein ACHQM5_008719 [Ranunculus cassubicifolius]